ncbi:unnamed protein product, partial [Mesorhabditis spiculigera]
MPQSARDNRQVCEKSPTSMPLLILFFLFGVVLGGCPAGTQNQTDPTSCLAVALNEYLTFNLAADRCFNEKGRMARLENAFDNRAASIAAQKLTLYEYFYIGLRKVNGSWFYQDDEFAELPLSYANWGPGEPADKPGFNCAIMNTLDSKWYARDCLQYYPYFCDLPALKTPGYCTDTAKADIFFMVDGSGNDDDRFLLHEVLRAFNSELQTQWYSKSGCQPALLNQQNTRVTGMIYYGNTTMAGRPVPYFCLDHFETVVSDTIANFSAPAIVSDISVALQSAHNYTEGKDCNCRRTAANYGTKQLMIWIPNSDQYYTSTAVSLDMLSTWNHFLLPVKFTKKEATQPLWTDPRMTEIVQPDRMNFIPTLVDTLWQFLCDQTGQTGPVPPTPFI